MASRRKKRLQKRKKKLQIPAVTEKVPGEEISAKIVTPIDRMVEILEKEGSMRLDKLSKMLKVPPPKLEEWTKILEERGLVKLEYPPFGKPLLRWVKSKTI